MNIVQSRRLRALIEAYPSVDNQPSGEAFHRAFRRYIRENRESLFDLTLAATSATIESAVTTKDIDPLLLKAIHDTNPGLSDIRLFELGPDEQMGVVNAAKGKYFEYLVVDRLERGEQVGSLALPDGYHAKLADSLTQPGWDIQIEDSHGHVAQYLQLKATDSVGYVRHALERYPDFKILATHEVGHFTADGGMVLDSDISNEQLSAHVHDAVDALDVSLVDSFVQYFNPLVPLLVIVGVEGYKLGVGKQSLDAFRLALLRRGQRVVAAKFAGAIVYALDGGLLSIPAAFAGGLWFDHTINRTAIAVAFQEHRSRLLGMRLYQQERLLLAEPS